MVDIRKRMHAGEAADLVIGSAALIDELIHAGRLRAGSRVDLVRSGIGVAVKKGARKPDVSSVEALTRSLHAAKSIAYSSGPSGVYLAGLFERLGIAAELKDRMQQMPPGALVGELAARGEKEIAFQHVTVFAGGIPAASKEPENAAALLAFLSSPSSAAAVRKHGFM